MTSISTTPPEGLDANFCVLAFLKNSTVSKTHKDLPIPFDRTIYGAEAPILLELNIWKVLSNFLSCIPDRYQDDSNVEITCSLETLQRLLAIQSRALNTFFPSMKDCETFYIHLPLEKGSLEKAKYLLIALFKDHIVGSFSVTAFRKALELNAENKHILENTSSLRLEPKVKVLATREYVPVHEDSKSLEFNIGQNQKLRFIFAQSTFSGNRTALQMPLNELIKKYALKDITPRILHSSAQLWSEHEFQNSFLDTLKKPKKQQNKECEALFARLLKNKTWKNDILMLFKMATEMKSEKEVSTFLFTGIKGLIESNADQEVVLLLIEEFTFLYPPHEDELFKNHGTETTHYDRAFNLVIIAYERGYFSANIACAVVYIDFFQRQIQKGAKSFEVLNVNKDRIISEAQRFFLRLITGHAKHGIKTPPPLLNVYKALQLVRWVQSYPIALKPLESQLSLVKMYERLLMAAEHYLCVSLNDTTFHTYLRDVTGKLPMEMPQNEKKEIFQLEFKAACKSIKKAITESMTHQHMLAAVKLFVMLVNQYNAFFSTEQTIEMAMEMFKELAALKSSDYQISILRNLLLIIDHYGADRKVTIEHYKAILKMAKASPDYLMSGRVILNDLFDIHNFKRKIEKEERIRLTSHASEVDILLHILDAVVVSSNHPSILKNERWHGDYKKLSQKILKALFRLSSENTNRHQPEAETLTCIQKLISEQGDLDLSTIFFLELLETVASNKDEKHLLLWLAWLCSLVGTSIALVPEILQKHITLLCKTAAEQKALSDANVQFIEQLVRSLSELTPPNIVASRESILNLFEKLTSDTTILEEDDNSRMRAIINKYMAIQLIRKVQANAQLLEIIDLPKMYRVIVTFASTHFASQLFNSGFFQHLYEAWQDLPKGYKGTNALFRLQFDHIQSTFLEKVSTEERNWKNRFALMFLNLLAEFPDRYDNRNMQQLVKIFEACCHTNNSYLLGLLPKLLSVLGYIEPNLEALNSYHQKALKACENNPGWLFNTTALSMISTYHTFINESIGKLTPVKKEIEGKKYFKDFLAIELIKLQLKTGLTILENKMVHEDKRLVLHYEAHLKGLIKVLSNHDSSLTNLKKVVKFTTLLQEIIREIEKPAISPLYIDYLIDMLGTKSADLDEAILAWMRWLYGNYGTSKTVQELQPILLSIFVKARKHGALKDNSKGINDAKAILNKTRV